MSRDALKRYTEMAVSLLGGRVPEVVYLPPELRRGNQRVTVDDITTTTDPTEREIEKRILAADPVGFLIAVMNGQPIPSFRVTRRGKNAERKHLPRRDRAKANEPDASITLVEEDGIEINADFITPTLSERKVVAQYLLANVMPNKKSASVKGKPGLLAPKPVGGQEDYDEMIARRARDAESAS